MKPNISEFSYGYALTEEIIRWPGASLTAAPVFPSLLQEGRTGGFDVALPFRGFPLFLQFKLSDFMKSRRAKECSEFRLLDPPFYRMYLRPLRYSLQHELLCDLEEAGNEVYYAAPTFHEPEELNSAYLNRNVARRSAFFRPESIGRLPDDDAHHVTFKVVRRNPLNLKAIRFSDPKLVEATAGNEIATRFLNRFDQQEAPSIEGIGDRLNEEMRRILFLRTDFMTEESFDRLNRLSSIERVAYWARTFFHTELYVVGRRD